MDTLYWLGLHFSFLLSRLWTKVKTDACVNAQRHADTDAGRLKMKLQRWLVLAMLFGHVAIATENGGSNYLPGFYGDFQMGSLPDKGVYLNNLLTMYQDHTGATASILEIPGLMYVPGSEVLGAKFALGVWPGVTFSKDHTNDSSLDRLALGDPYLMPVLLNWSWEDLQISLYEGIIVPVGYYEKDHLNIGRNIWTFDHNLSLTYRLPAGNEFSMNFGFMNNTENAATHYTTGDELHLDYVLGHYFSQEFALGVVGSFHKQVTADQAPEEILAKEYTQASTIGPVIMYNLTVAGKDISTAVKWLHEFDTQGHLRQDFLIFRLYYPF